MKKMNTYAILFLSILMLFLIVFMIYAINRGGIHFSSRNINAKLVNTQHVNLDDINQVIIKYKSDDIIFYTHNKNELVIEEYMNYRPSEDQLATINKSNDTLKIQGGDRRSVFPFFNTIRYVEIYLPTDYTKSLSVTTSSGNIDSEYSLTLTNFTIECRSGNIKLNEIYADALEISTTSGNVNLSRGEINKEFFLTATSGDIRVNELRAEKINASTTSGNITFHNAEGQRDCSSSSGNIKIYGGKGDTDARSSSGNIKIENCTGKMNVLASSGNIDIIALSGYGNFQTTSGNIDLDFLGDSNSLQNDLHMVAASGNINLLLPSNLDFDFEAKSSNGYIHTYFDDMLSFNKRGNEAKGRIGNHPKLSIRLETSSGNIRIKNR
ncbi:MAG TPA: DUF4097 domain-containing protein [Clostridiales bacterium]|nr:DUF4097 domain-containing protein [Clostridiales bacterium]